MFYFFGPISPHELLIFRLTIKEKVNQGLSGGGGRATMRSAWPARPRPKARIACSVAVAVALAAAATVTVAVPVVLVLDVAVMVAVAVDAGGAETLGAGARGHFRQGQ